MDKSEESDANKESGTDNESEKEGGKGDNNKIEETNETDKVQLGILDSASLQSKQTVYTFTYLVFFLRIHKVNCLNLMVIKYMILQTVKINNIEENKPDDEVIDNVETDQVNEKSEQFPEEKSEVDKTELEDEEIKSENKADDDFEMSQNETTDKVNHYR